MSKTRRKFDKDFKLEAIRMVQEGGMSKAEVGRRLGINDCSIASDLTLPVASI
jgi:transposase-like protein